MQKFIGLLLLSLLTLGQYGLAVERSQELVMEGLELGITHSESIDMDDHTFIKELEAALQLRKDNPYNFCAGPGMNYTRVIKQIALQLFSFQGGIGIQELSHRDKGGPVQKLMLETKARIKRVLDVPDSHEILLMAGGAHFQFDTVPANLLKGSKQADFADSGFWSKRAKSHMDKLGYSGRLVDVIHRDPSTGEVSIAPVEDWNLSPEAAYVHICDNETIEGIQYRVDPKLALSEKRPLVSDATSSLLSRKMRIENYGIVYASGGKNLGPAGVTLVIIRRDLLQDVQGVGLAQEYKNYFDFANLYNTPDMISISFLNETFKVVETEGLINLEQRAIRRSEMIYKTIDASQGFYINKVQSGWRSITTIPFRIYDRQLEEKFVEEAEAAGFQQVRGHHSVGGLRISLYNPVPDEAIGAFAQFLKGFQYRHEPTSKLD